MAAPTQVYPSWLTPVVTVITDAVGAPIATSTTVLFLPLTYYGPPIPLNPDWVYGGLFSPTTTLTTPVPTEITTSAATPLPTSATPPVSVSSLSSLSTSAIPTSSVPTTTSVTLSPSLTTTVTTTRPPPSSTVISNAVGKHLTRGQLIGVIVAGILGLIFLFVLALSLYLFFKNRRNRRSEARFSMITPIEQDYFVVGDTHTPGEGSPRQSGEEADPFLQARAGGSAGGPPRASGSRPSGPVPPPTGSLSSSGKSSSTNSGYGVLLDRPSLNILPITQEDYHDRRGNILSPEQLRRMDDENVLPRNSDPPEQEEYSPLMPPPRLVDPASSGSRPSVRPLVIVPKASQQSRNAEGPVLAAPRRIQAEDLASRSAGNSPTHELHDTGVLPRRTSISDRASHLLGSIANIGRLSWFSKHTADSSTNRSSRVLGSTPFSDADLEAGHALLSPIQMSENRSLSLRGFSSDPERPISSVSARSGTSGGTVYHDAHSSVPGTPPLAPPPRALTPASNSNSPEIWQTTYPLAPHPRAPQPPNYDDQPLIPLGRRSPEATNADQQPADVDILDTPVPLPVSPFASSSSRDSSSTIGIRAQLLPPGLATPQGPSAATRATPSQGSFGLDSVAEDAGISIDVLEEEPPVAGEGWRSMAAVVSNVMADGQRRMTFGLPQYVHQPDHTSEQGSLHSMRSHLEPHSSRSTGSAPASRKDGSSSYGSASSKARTASSGLSHSGSISSDGRRRLRSPTSPTLSAFGHVRAGPSNGSSGSNGVPPMAAPRVNSPPAAYVPGSRAMSPNPPVGQADPSSPTSPLINFGNAPWAAGLDQDWAPS